MSDPLEIPVDPARLADGGDIAESYSADRFPEDNPMRTPFWHQSKRYVCTGRCYGGPGRLKGYCEAYLIVDPSEFDGEPLPYCEQQERWRSAGDQRDFNHGYTGMLAKIGSKKLVLVGPKIRFVPDDDLAMPTKQEALF
ncbi:MAG: hypothetical protein ACR2RF_23765 [Geminicoccaceae bacterium]